MMICSGVGKVNEGRRHSPVVIEGIDCPCCALIEENLRLCDEVSNGKADVEQWKETVRILQGQLRQAAFVQSV